MLILCCKSYSVNTIRNFIDILKCTGKCDVQVFSTTEDTEKAQRSQRFPECSHKGHRLSVCRENFQVMQFNAEKLVSQVFEESPSIEYDTDGDGIYDSSELRLYSSKTNIME